MPAQVEVAAVGDPLELGPADREEVLDVAGLRGVVRELVGLVRAQPQMIRRAPPVADTSRVAPPSSTRTTAPPASGGTKYSISICSNSRVRKMKLPGVISLRNDLPTWAMPNGGFLRANCSHGLEVDEDPLRGLGSQVDRRARLLDRADRRLEHQVEVARVGEVAVGELAGVHRRLAAAGELLEVVGAEALLAGAAVDERIGEVREVTRGLPGARVLQDRRVQRDDVVALLEHRAPPFALHVGLQQDAVMPVVVRRADAAVDLRAREDEAAPLAQRDDLLHRDHVVHRRGC